MEQTISQVFRERVQKYRNRLSVEEKRKGMWRQATWDQYYERSRAVGLGLYQLGVRKGDRVCILSSSRLEWIYADMGIFGIGGIVVPIYQSLLDEEVRHYINNAEARYIIVENHTQLQKALYAYRKNTVLEKIIIMDTEGCELDDKLLIGYDAVMESGRTKHEKDSRLFDRLVDSITEDDIATYIYTPGTTGVPKGVMISHGNIMASMRILDAIDPPICDDNDNVVGFLPLAHAYERIVVHFYAMYRGITKHYAESLETLVDDIMEKRPTIMFAVPQFLERIYQGILLGVRQEPAFKQRIFTWAQYVGSEICKCRQERRSIPFSLRLQYKVAYEMIFKKLHQALGGNIRWISVTGAPTPREIVEFFNAAGVLILEGYAMTESCTFVALNTLDKFKAGSAGRPLPGIDMKIADDGEILIKGDNVFKGYWRLEKESREAFTEDGYFHSGDIGIFTADRFLIITDRKKDLIITSAGKNIAPQKIEKLFRMNPLFSQFVVFGDRRKYLIALVNLNMDVAAQIAEENNIQFDKPQDLLGNKDFLALVDEMVEEKNKHLAPFEIVKRYKIIETEFSKDTGELSVSAKIKRNSIHAKYIDVIESLYPD
jgi:long-chain acyl-CoA synthetase